MKINIEKNAKPFLKWAGGKTQILNKIRFNYPEKSDITRYCEPFVGGGAVFFDMISIYKFKYVLLNDINSELINTYLVIRDELKKLLILLNDMQKKYDFSDNENKKKFYYLARSRFNHIKNDIGNNIQNIEKAALFIFLNKTCFNGLYRVNSKNIFNVPMGNYKKPYICNSENLIAVSKILKNVHIKCGDYSECLSFINDSTFVYIDPPYRPITKTANFTSYTESQFNDFEQIKLAKFVDKLN